MTKTQTTRQTTTEGGARARTRADAATNEVRLVGRLTGDPLVVELPSGDLLATFRISVPRTEPGAAAQQGGVRQRVDSIPCTAWSPGLRRRITSWRPGDTVEITGAVRCRFYQAGGATRSRVEVEARAARIVSRAPAA